jgi:hypothetical protein
MWSFLCLDSLGFISLLCHPLPLATLSDLLASFLAPLPDTMWEAEIRKIMVPRQPEQKQACKTPSQQKKAEHGGVCLLSQLGLNV